MRPLFFALALLSAFPARSQDPVPDAAFAEAADALVAETLDLFGTVPGLAVAVVRDGRTVYVRGFGYADREAGEATTADTPFYIASATKPFTALLAALADHDGTLALDASLASLFPDVAFASEAGADAVTVRHLLSHTAGVENEPLAFRAAYTGQHTPALMRRLLAGTVPNPTPRGTYRYTNTGYNVLSLRLDQDGPWQDQLAERVLRPLGMTRATAYASEAALRRPAVPYAVHPARGVERVALVKHDDTMQAAGGLYASATDLARWLTAHLNEGRVDGRQVVPAEVVAESHRPVVTGRDERYGPFGRDGYALGWHTGTYDGEPMLHHLGGFSGFHAHTSFMPGRDLGVVVLANEADTGGRLATLLASFVYDWWAAEPGARDAVVEQVRDARAELHAGLTGYLDRARAQLEERAEGTWQLSLAPSTYAGIYENPTWGVIEVEAAGDGIAVRFGRLYGPATPYSEPETVRVELVPGRGEAVAFDLEGGRVLSLRYDGQTFVRTAD
ncbi:serine hydrolase domain-containing protein [Rubrivirga sp.]|uniref:serine hydrolase domain-containing protein n=1 Tax=Rubrivirga sp. TaxID=1885344 RepID=UPI003B51F27F